MRDFLDGTPPPGLDLTPTYPQADEWTEQEALLAQHYPWCGMHFSGVCTDNCIPDQPHGPDCCTVADNVVPIREPLPPEDVTVWASSSGWGVQWKAKPAPEPTHPPGTYVCRQCRRTWPKKPLFRSHPFPKGHRPPAYPEGESMTLFGRCPGRPRPAQEGLTR